MRQGHQILVIEDNEADVFMIRKALETDKLMADLHIVNDGKAATEFFAAVDAEAEALRPDLVLLDMNLPKKNGDEVLRGLRASTNCRDALVLIVSSSAEPRDRSAVASFGIAGWFRKPRDYDEYMKLGEIVKALLDPASVRPASDVTAGGAGQ